MTYVDRFKHGSKLLISDNWCCTKIWVLLSISCFDNYGLFRARSVRPRGPLASNHPGLDVLEFWVTVTYWDTWYFGMSWIWPKDDNLLDQLANSGSGFLYMRYLVLLLCIMFMCWIQKLIQGYAKWYYVISSHMNTHAKLSNMITC